MEEKVRGRAKEELIAMSGALEATGGWASFEPPLPFGFEWKTLRWALLGWRHGQGEEEEEGGGRDARCRRRTRPPAGEVRDGGRGEGGERRQDSRPPAGEARDGGRGEEEEEVVHAGARQNSRSPAGEAREGGGSSSRKEEDGKPMRAIIEARREKVGCLWRTKIKRKVLGYSAAVQLELLRCGAAGGKNNYKTTGRRFEGRGGDIVKLVV